MIKKMSELKFKLKPPFVFALILLATFLIVGLRKSVSRGAQADDAGARLRPRPFPTQPLPSATPTPLVTAAPVSRPLVKTPPVQYNALKNDADKLAFVRSRAQSISLKISNSHQPYDFTPEVVASIKKSVDDYARRIGRGGVKFNVRDGCGLAAQAAQTRQYLWRENLQSLYGRASCYAPLINKSFNDENVPPVIGLYIAMIESEYHVSLESPVGARGMFQFMPGTADDYDVNPRMRDDVNIMAPAAARYIKDRIGQFGSDSLSVTLAIAGYNRGPNSVDKDLDKVADKRRRQREETVEAALNGVRGDERSFWVLVTNSDVLDKFFNNENKKYVPKFFAAAIIGEYPDDFGLQLNPLSTYVE